MKGRPRCGSSKKNKHDSSRLEVGSGATYGFEKRQCGRGRQAGNGFHIVGRCMRTLIAITFLLPIVAGCATASKSDLDAEVRRLCALDGGVTVYETAQLPPQYVSKYRRYDLPFEQYATARDPFFLRHYAVPIRGGNPSLTRLVTEVVRRSDEKILGRSIAYMRRGGDLPSPMHESSFMCPNHSDLLPRVFGDSRAPHDLEERKYAPDR